MQQKRLIFALLISTAILFLWSYLVPSPQPPATTAPTQATPAPASSPVVSPVVASSSPSSSPSGSPAATPSGSPSESAVVVPHRTLVIKSPFYQATLDSHGAEVVSWLITRNRDSKQEIYSVAGPKKAQIPLELVSPEGLKRQPREVPLQLRTGDAAVDVALSSTDYTIEGVDGSSGDSEIVLGAADKRRITFRLNDKTTGLDVVKTMTFSGDRYSVDFEVSIKQGDKAFPQTKVRVDRVSAIRASSITPSTPWHPRRLRRSATELSGSRPTLLTKTRTVRITCPSEGRWIGPA